MEEDQTSLRSTDAKQWERPWSTAEIREHSANWTLAGDTGLLHMLQEYAQNLISRTHETEKLVNELVYKNKAVSAKVNNVINAFQMLSNEQFVENRVYDEAVEDPKPSPDVQETQKTKEQREAEMLPRVTRALEIGLSVLDQAFHEVQVEETSDSEEDEHREEGQRIILEPKDPYEYRPLPFIIGSEEFHQDDLVGLRDLYAEDLVEKVVDEESVSVASSLSSSSLSESDMEIETPYPKDSVVTEDYVKETVPPKIDRPRSSASEGSDLFDIEKEEEEDFAPNVEADQKLLRENEQNKRLGTDDLVKEVKSVIKNKIESDVVKVPQPLKQEKYDDDLFGSVESDDIIEENSPFQKKSGGLFSTDLAFTNGKDDVSDNDDDDDLFGTKEKTIIPPKSEKSKTTFPQAVSSSKEAKGPDLFGESEGENEDIFSALSSSKMSFSVPQPSSTTIKNEEKDTAESSYNVNPVSDLTKKKSNNTISGFDDRSSSDSLFGDDSTMDDLFASKPEKKSSNDQFDPFLAGDANDGDLFSSLKFQSSDNVESRKKEKVIKEEQPSLQSKKPEPKLFDDDDDDDFDLFGSTKKPSLSGPKKDTSDIFNAGKETPTSKNGPSKEVSLVKGDPVKEPPKITSLETGTQSLIPATRKDTKTIVPAKESSGYVRSVTSKTDTPPLSLQSDEDISNKKLSLTENEADVSVSFDEPADHHSTLNAINKGRAKIPGKRRKPTRKAKHVPLTAENTDSDFEESTKKTAERNSSLFQSDLSVNENSSDLFSSAVSDVTSPALITPKKLAPVGISQNIMSQMVSEMKNTKIGKKGSLSKSRDSFDDDDDIFSPLLNDQRNSKISKTEPLSPKQEIIVENVNTSVIKAEASGSVTLDSDSTPEDDLFSDAAFKGFRTSLSEKDSIFGLDDDDDIFKVVESNKEKSGIPSADSSDDIFAYPEEDDIFAGVGKEKYELISNKLYEDHGDDIFENLDTLPKQTPSGSKTTKKTSKVEAPKTEPVDIFDDPLTGFTSD